MIVPNPGAIAVKPCQWHLGAQPIWGEHRQAIQGMAQGLAHTLQAVEDANGSKLMGGVDALGAMGFEEPRSRPLASNVIEQPLFRLPRDQPGLEFAQYSSS
jgi:hypothetical protein